MEMSFSRQVKTELERQVPEERHCMLAELSAIARVCGEYETDQYGEMVLSIHTENELLARKVFTLLEKTYNIGDEVHSYTSIRSNPATGSNIFYVLSQGNALKAVQDAPVEQECCKRAYIKGAFLAAGSVSNPRKSYHLEIVCDTEDTAQQLQWLIQSFSIDAKIVKRKKNYVVYLKDGDGIENILKIMGAHDTIVSLEDIRSEKGMRNDVNRRVNCETANINKTVSAAVKQVRDIQLLVERIGLQGLPEGLREIAVLRLENQDATLRELGNLLETPIGKSGVNHRLRKLSEIAEAIRNNQEEEHG